jgi:hypothetical protein
MYPQLVNPQTQVDLDATERPPFEVR